MAGIMGMSMGLAAAMGAGAAAMGSVLSIFGIRKLIQIGQYSYHNSRLSTLGNPYVKREEVLPLLEISSAESLAKSIVTDLDVGSDLSEFREIDRALTSSLHGVIERIGADSPPHIVPLINAYLSRFEGEELKRLLRVFGKRKDPLLPVGWLNEDVERAILSSDSISSVMDILEGQPVSGRISEILKVEGKPSLSSIDEAIDRYVLDVIKGVSIPSLSAKRGCKSFFNLMCDRYNIHMAMRKLSRGEGKENGNHEILYLSGGSLSTSTLEQIMEAFNFKEGVSILATTHLGEFFKEMDQSDPYSLETALDRMFLQGAVSMSYSYSSTVGPTIRYLVSKEMEQRNLRTLFYGLMNGWDPERTRRRLILEEGS